tara:strand:- start:387 stop:722 length:336 start_codon:yes stop_codon:yes gene_type:complete
MGNIYTNYKADLATNTNPVVLYTVPDKIQAVIKSIRVSDDSAAGSTITATITDAASAVFSLGKDIVVGAAVPVELLTQPLIAKQGEIITVTPGNADRLHVVLSVLEINNNT